MVYKKSHSCFDRNSDPWRRRIMNTPEEKEKEIKLNDTDRLDLIQSELLIIHPPAPCGDEFDGLWVICDYTLPRYSDYISRDKDLRKAIDGAVGLNQD